MRKPGRFMAAALGSYAIGWLWICCFLAGFTDSRYENTPLDRLAAWYAAVFTAAFLLWSWLLLRKKVPASREHWFWLGCTVVIAAAIAVGGCNATSGWSVLALHGFGAYWVVCRSGLLTEGETSDFLPYDLLETFIILPFSNFFLRITTLFYGIYGLFSRSENSATRRRAAAVSAAVVVVVLPVFLMAGNLLGQADSLFAEIWASMGRFFTLRWSCPEWLPPQLLRLAFGIPVGAYLFGLVGGSFRREKPRLDRSAARQSLEKLRFAPEKTAAGVLCAFLALYLLFFGVQAQHLLGAFLGNVPGTLTASQYARQGFFQLCQVMGINFVLLGAVFLCSRSAVREHSLLRRLSMGLMVESIFLAVTAASKLVLYISRFGFTPLRLLSMWGILVLCAGAILAICSLRKPCKAMQKWVWFAAASFTLLCLY